MFINKMATPNLILLNIAFGKIASNFSSCLENFFGGIKIEVARKSSLKEYSILINYLWMFRKTSYFLTLPLFSS